MPTTRLEAIRCLVEPIDKTTFGVKAFWLRLDTITVTWGRAAHD